MRKTTQKSMQAVYQNGLPEPCPEIFNMAQHTLGHGKTPDKIALAVISKPGTVAENWTYAALLNTVLTRAGALRQIGVNPQDRVVLHIGNRSDFPILFFALNALGAVPVPVSNMLTETELKHVIQQTDPKMLITDTPLNQTPCAQLMPNEITAAEPIDFAKTAAEDAAYIVFTSGTGGQPKGVVHAQRAAWARRMMWDGWYGLTAKDKVLHAGAFNWTYTLGAGLTDPWAIGATAQIFAGEKTKAVWGQLAQSHQPSIFAAAPGIFRQILTDPINIAPQFSSLRHCLTAGEALPVNVAKTWITRTCKPIYEALGMSEISTYISHSPITTPRAGSSGKPQKGRKVAILNNKGTPVLRNVAGNLAVHATDPGLMLHYLSQPITDREWFITGDRAMMDDDGYITHLGRADDILNAGGYRVSAQEIINTLLTIHGISEAIVLDILIKKDTRVLTAFYTGEHIPADTIKSHCALTLAAYKCPRQIVHLDVLPRSENGKILTRTLREKYEWK